jgi:hypothetical protein
MLKKFSHAGVESAGKRRRLITCLIACLLVSTALYPNRATAQPRTTVKTTEKALERRKRAVELIVETADAARTFKDLFYRARIQTRAADSLWPYDEERARSIFRRAWEAATAFDRSEQEAEARESGVPSTLMFTEARDEVLAAAAARDSKLAEAFLKDLLPEKAEASEAENNKTETPRKTPWREVSVAGQRRLALAYELLSLNNPQRAAQVATPVIAEGESGELMAFVTRLRESEATIGENFYLRLLERTSRDIYGDTNTVLLLSSQIRSPWFLEVVDDRGSVQFRRLDSSLTGGAYLPVVAQSVRAVFLEIAGKVLLRPLIPSGGHIEVGETIALYIAINRLLPYFQRESPNHSAALMLRSSSLANEIDAARREMLDSQLAVDTLTPVRPGDALRPQLDQLGRAKDAADRDRIALGIVKKAAQKRLWDRAKRAAMEIEDVDSRRSALSYIAVCQIADLLRTFEKDKEENFDRLAKFVRSADVPRLATAWGLAQIALMTYRKGDKENAAALLDEAVTFAARTPAGTWQRVSAYTAVTRLAVGIDAKRAWEILPEVVRSANALEDYTGDEGSIDIEVVKNNAELELEPLSVGDEIFQVDGLFTAIAQLDHDRALSAARSLGRETPRAFASLAIANVMLGSSNHKGTETQRKPKDDQISRYNSLRLSILCDSVPLWLSPSPHYSL